MGETYKPRPAAEVTTEDLIVTIARDRDCVATFEARAEFAKRCGSDWRDYAPFSPREWITDPNDGGRIAWLNFHEEGVL